MIRFPLRLLVLAVLLVAIAPVLAQEVIYDNTTTFLNHFADERREYGSQLDLAGTARALSEIEFFYYADFVPKGTQLMKLRLYSNETQYDNYRKSPTRLLFESEFIPLSPGYNVQTLTNLHVELPPNTVTFTMEVTGLGTNDHAGLLMYHPPTVGYTFNEFWGRDETGNWRPFLYSTTDPSLKAKAAVRLTAFAEAHQDQAQTDSDTTISMRDGNTRLRLAQTFTAGESGHLGLVKVQMNWTGAPLRVAILDAANGAPGTNLLGSTVIPNDDDSPQTAQIYDAGVYVTAGMQYTIELSTDEPLGPKPNYALHYSRAGGYSGGALWSRDENGGAWQRVGGASTPGDASEAYFETWMVPGGPPVEITSPLAGDKLFEGEPITVQSVIALPNAKVPVNLGLFVDGEQVLQDDAAPFGTLVWSNAPPGMHTIQVVAQDYLKEPFRSDPAVILVRGKYRPPNDDFDRRAPLQGRYTHALGSSGAATLEPGEPRVSTNVAGATLWWRWTAPDGAPVTVSAQHSERPAVAGVFLGDSLESLVPIASGRDCVFTPIPGREYQFVIDPRNRGSDVVLDIASADVGLVSPPSDVRMTAPSAINLVANDSANRRITRVQFLANGIVLREFSAPPFSFAQSFPTTGYFDLTVAATDTQGITTYSAPRRLTVVAANGKTAGPASIHAAPNGTLQLDLDTIQNFPITIEYSDDLSRWRTANGLVPGTGSHEIWIDDGPPKTYKAPGQIGRRFYRFK